MEAKRTSRKVIVLGAGLAGLTAAYELSEAGHQVTVLEAASRPGGRVCTLRDAFADGLCAEAGAAFFVPIEPDPVAEYAKRFNLPVVRSEPHQLPSLWYLRGKRIRAASFLDINWPLGLTAEEKKLGLLGMRNKYLKPAVDELLGARQAGWPRDVIEKYDQVSFANLLAAHHASPDATWLLALADWDLVGEDLREHSALDLLTQTAAYSTFPAARYAIEGGNDILPKTFAFKLGENIRYGAAAVSIEQGAKGVRVGYVQGGVRETIAGDYLVCTLPFSVLRKVRFSPRLSPGKQRAITQIPYGSAARVFIQFRRRFWVDDGLSGFTFTDGPITFLWDAAPHQKGPRGVLQGFLTGPRARKFARISEAARMRFALDQIEPIYPQARGLYEAGVSKCWDEDFGARGAWAWFKPGQMTTMLPHLATAEGRVHFAGEHTASMLFRSLAQGAVESGLRVAQEIKDRVNR